MKHYIKPSVKKQIPFIILFLLALLCGAVYLVNSFCDIDIYHPKAVAFRLILSAVTGTVFSILLPVSLFFNFQNIQSLLLRIGAGTFSLIVSVSLLFTGYVTPLKPVYTQSDPHPNPLLDIRKAAIILQEQSEPCETFGFFSCISYTTFLTSLKVEEIKATRYALRNNDNLEIISSGEQAGLYTVIYKPDSRLPCEIRPYNPDCGENVLKWAYFSDQDPDWPSQFPDLPYIKAEKLTRTFPRMVLRISKDGETVKESIYQEADDTTNMMPNSFEPGTYTAQLLASFPDSAGYGKERFCPISNVAELKIT